MEKNKTITTVSHGDFIASVCQCLPQSELKDWLPEGVIYYRNVCFVILPDQCGDMPMLSIAIDLGEIAQEKRLSAYRHMATYNLAKGSPDHGVLGLNYLSPDAAMHRLFFPKTNELQPTAFARSLYALASHALNFRSSYGKKTSQTNLAFSRLLSSSRMDKGEHRAR